MTRKKINYQGDHPLYDIHQYGVDLDANHLYLMGVEEYNTEEHQEPGVEYVMANRFIKNLNILMRRSSEPILIHMKTCGGYWEEGMAIYDSIKSCPNRICILNYSHARSMSSIIFQAADKRVMMPNSTFMFHDGTIGVWGTAKQFLTEAEELKKSSTTMMNIYIDSMKNLGKLSKWSRKRIAEWLREQMDKREEVYLNASQAVEYGFADEIFGENGEHNWDSLLAFEE